MNQYRWNDLTLGLKHTFQASITEQMMLHFCQDSGDHNPLHLDAEYAAEHGFPNRVAYGLLTSSFYSTLAGVYLPGKFCLLHGIDITFMNPVFVGDLLTVSGEITYLNDAYRQIQISARIDNANGTQVSKAKIKAGVLCAEGPQP
ncbi:3-hydroxybutyryl-CoA dehydratase [Oxalobacteraceae bacterium GrIS 1.11]